MAYKVKTSFFGAAGKHFNAGDIIAAEDYNSLEDKSNVELVSDELAQSPSVQLPSAFLHDLDAQQSVYSTPSQDSDEGWEDDMSPEEFFNKIEEKFVRIVSKALANFSETMVIEVQKRDEERNATRKKEMDEWGEKIMAAIAAKPAQTEMPI